MEHTLQIKKEKGFLKEALCEGKYKRGGSSSSQFIKVKYAHKGKNCFIDKVESLKGKWSATLYDHKACVEIKKFLEKNKNKLNECSEVVKNFEKKIIKDFGFLGYGIGTGDEVRWLSETMASASKLNLGGGLGKFVMDCENYGGFYRLEQKDKKASTKTKKSSTAQ